MPPQIKNGPTLRFMLAKKYCIQKKIALLMGVQSTEEMLESLRTLIGMKPSGPQMVNEGK
jgi:hypothetical protein